MTAQAASFTHTCFMVTPYEGYVAVAERLNALTPGDHEKRTALFNSGAEAVENAVKIARAYTKKDAVVAFDHAYHGRTNLTMALTAKNHAVQVRLRPVRPRGLPRAAVLPVPRRRCHGAEAAKRAISVIEKQVGAENLAALVIEPIQGEGGFIVPAEGFLPALVEWCRANDVVFIADEVQTGFARTGAMFASEHEGIVPDLIATAKGIAGGLPLSAVTGRAEIMDAAHAGGLGGTYGGNPLACAAALATIETIEAGRPRRARPRHRRAHDAPAARPAAARPAHRRRPRPRRDDRRRARRPGTKEPDAALTKNVAAAAHAAGRHRPDLRHLRQRPALPAAAVHLRRAARRGRSTSSPTPSR